MSLAPIALFVYRRPDHTRRTIGSLRACPEFARSPVIVYSDGPRDAAAVAGVAATRAVVLELLPDARVVEAAANRGLAVSIIAGVDALTGEYGRVIVVEDDLIVDPRFLEFLNAGLEHYADTPQVMQISGFQHAVSGLAEPVLLPLTTSWGWATWRRAWVQFDPDCKGADRLDNDPALARRFDLDGAMPYTRMFARQRAGTIDSWAIRWYWTVFASGGLVVYPPKSLVTNAGFDGSGTHGVASIRTGTVAQQTTGGERLLTFPDRTVADTDALALVRNAARRDFGGSSNVFVKAARAARARLHALVGA